MRKHFIYSIGGLLACSMMLASCLGNNDDDITYYDDTALTAFSLGTLKYNKRVNADSVASTTLDCSSYKFYIDQQKRLVYNTDSLPVGVDVSKTVATISSKNSGTIVLKSINSDSLSYWSSTDSVDFTQPRKVRIYNHNGEYREYTVSVNVHKQYGDTLTWSNMGTLNALTAYSGMRIYATADRLFLLTNAAGFTASRPSAANWSQMEQQLDASAYINSAVLNDTLYVLSGGRLLRTSDGQSWKSESTQIKRFLGASKTKLYAFDADGNIASSSDGATWTAEKYDASTAWLPANDISLCAQQLQTNEDSYRLLLCGNRDYAQGDSTAVVWGKIEEPSTMQTQAWSLFNWDVTNPYPLHALSNLQVVAYDGMFVALGSSTMTNGTNWGATGFYRSADNGITWQRDTTMALPSGFSSPKNFAITTDKDHYLWIADATTGIVWRGRINRLGWAEEQKAFTK